MIVGKQLEAQEGKGGATVAGIIDGRIPVFKEILGEQGVKVRGNHLVTDRPMNLLQGDLFVRILPEHMGLIINDPYRDQSINTNASRGVQIGPVTELDCKTIEDALLVTQ